MILSEPSSLETMQRGTRTGSLKEYSVLNFLTSSLIQEIIYVTLYSSHKRSLKNPFSSFSNFYFLFTLISPESKTD